MKTKKIKCVNCKKVVAAKNTIKGKKELLYTVEFEGKNNPCKCCKNEAIDFCDYFEEYIYYMGKYVNREKIADVIFEKIKNNEKFDNYGNTCKLSKTAINLEALLKQKIDDINDEFWKTSDLDGLRKIQKIVDKWLGEQKYSNVYLKTNKIIDLNNFIFKIMLKEK